MSSMAAQAIRSTLRKAYIALWELICVCRVVYLLQVGLHEQYGGIKPHVARDAHAAATLSADNLLYCSCRSPYMSGVKPDLAHDAHTAVTTPQADYCPLHRLHVPQQVGLHKQYGSVKPDVARDAQAAAIHSTVDEAATAC
jgi:tRNA A37 threonylcarbamoyltransferase TsaD